jgi:hypothetical protein
VKTLLKLLFAVSVLAMITGCTQLEASPAPEPRASEAQPGPDSEPISCTGSIQGEIEKTVNSQTSAFAESNFELAYSFASPTFRSNVSLDGFVEIIASSYGPLIESSQLRFSNCLVNADTGFALIDVSFLESGDFVYGLRYLMTQTSDGWRVEGAGDLEVVGEGT